MVHMMETDSSHITFSPLQPFRGRRPISMHSSSTQNGKRARSPDGGTSVERPAKRQFSSLVNRTNIRQLSGSPHPEDWVLQAGGLSIDSPLNPSTPSCVPSPQNDSEDVDMAIDDEATVRTETSYFDVIPTENAQYVLSAPPSPGTPFTPRHRLGVVSFPIHQTPTFSRVGPSINVLPPTPSAAQQMQSHTQRQPSHPFSTPPQPPLASTSHDMSPTPMVVSPKMSFAQPSLMLSPTPVQTPSKKRLIMGPKAGCEKCRLGVKGHYMHYE